MSNEVIKHREVELLSPAGDLERLKTAVRYGANAVFIGGKKFSLRSRASNFDVDDIAKGVAFAHAHNARVHVTTNMILHNEDWDGASEYLRQLDEAGVDAIICASLAFAKLAKQVAPRMEVHLSTQCSTLNLNTIEFYQRQGIDRVVLARELTLDEIEYVVKNSPLPIEVFIHGGMCMSYSGRCMLSNHMTLRDANRGGCAQSCRWKYRMYDGDTPIHDENCKFSMSSKDMVAAKFIPALIDMGVASFKIEGRMKSNYYVANVVHGYRSLIDGYVSGDYKKYGSLDAFIEMCEKELQKAENRKTSTGFYAGLPRAKDHLYDINGSGVVQDYVAIVKAYDESTQIATIEVRNNFTKGTLMEVLSPRNLLDTFVVEEMMDSEGNTIEVANKPMQIVSLKVDLPLHPHDMIRKVKIDE